MSIVSVIKEGVNRLMKKCLIFVFLLIVCCSSLDVCVLADEVKTTDYSMDFEDDRAYIGKSLNVVTNCCMDDIFFKWYIDNNLIDNNGSEYLIKEDDYGKWIIVELYTKEDGVLRNSIKIWVSNLPVVYIDTNDGQSVTTKDEYKSAEMIIQGNEKYKEQYNGKINIKGRGNYTWTGYEKKPYKIKLDKKTNLFGMGKNKHYVLLANATDVSLMKNKLVSDFANKIGLQSMSSEPVDVVFNGDYIGQYLLAEHVRIDSERIDIFDWEKLADSTASSISKEKKDEIAEVMKTDLSWIDTKKVVYDGQEYTIDCDMPSNNGGYLLELDAYFDEKSKFMANETIPVMINSPENLYSSEYAMNYLKDYIESFDTALQQDNYFADYNGELVHYSELFDFNSLVNYYLVDELFYNAEGSNGFKSLYAYKDIDSKMFLGPVWDFDSCMGSYRKPEFQRVYSYEGWRSTNKAVRWSSLLNNDPYYIIKFQERYWEIRESLINDLIKEGGDIDNLYEYINDSGEINFIKWNLKDEMQNELNYKDAVDNTKAWLINRIGWLDVQMATQDGLVNSFNTDTVGNNYEKDNERLKIAMTNVFEDSLSKNAKADGCIYSEEPLNMTLFMTQGVAKVELFINTRKYSSLEINEIKKEEIIIPADELNETDGKKNVISLVAYDAENNVIGRNFVTVITQKCIHEFEHYIKNDATCESEGNIEYWKCVNCNKTYNGEDAKESVLENDIVLPMLGHDIKHIESVSPGCSSAGNIEYWKCSRCGKVYLDSTLDNCVDETEIILTEKSHDLIHFEYKASSCLSCGNKEYWRCTRCDKLFRDNDAKVEVDKNDIVLTLGDHCYTKASTLPTCSEKGTTMYSCSVCGDCYTEVDDPALGHTWGEGVVTVAPTKDTIGLKKYVCVLCGVEEYEKIDKIATSQEGLINVDVVGKVIICKNNTYRIICGKNKNYEVEFLKSRNENSVVIPKNIKFNGKTYKVSKIHDNALKNNKKIKRVIIGENVTYIGKKSFYNCSNLKLVIIKSNKIKSVGKDAFIKISKNSSIKVTRKKITAYKKKLKGKYSLSRTKIKK